MDIDSAERLYKQALREERAAWDALFALPPTPDRLRVWRRATIEADQARAAFLERAVFRPNKPAPNDPEDHRAMKQALKQAIQQQKAAWTVYERSMAAGSADADDLRVRWGDAIARVRAVRKLVHEQGFAVTAAARQVESTRANSAPAPV